MTLGSKTEICCFLFGGSWNPFKMASNTASSCLTLSSSFSMISLSSVTESSKNSAETFTTPQSCAGWTCRPSASAQGSSSSLCELADAGTVIQTQLRLEELTATPDNTLDVRIGLQQPRVSPVIDCDKGPSGCMQCDNQLHHVGNARDVVYLLFSVVPATCKQSSGRETRNYLVTEIFLSGLPCFPRLPNLFLWSVWTFPNSTQLVYWKYIGVRWAGGE